MRKEDFYNTLNNIEDKYILEAKKETTKMIQFKNMKTICAMAACLCIICASVFMFNNFGSNKPHPDMVQIPNPLLEVNSLDEMEQYLDFKVPTLSKDVESYVVLVVDNYPTMARITYADGSTFNKQYGSGDISGIYGGTFAKTEQVGKVEVNFYTYTDWNGTAISYAIWENDGFAYSLARENTTFEQLAVDIQSLMK